MKFEHEPQYDFDDVLIKPKRSELNSRAEVSIERTFKFRHTDKTLTCVPVFAANMDTVGTHTLAKDFSKRKMCVALHKFHTKEQLDEIFLNPETREYTFYSFGLRDGEYENFKEYQKTIGVPLNICVDVPSAYIEKFLKFLEKVRQENPKNIIMAGNVVTREMTEALILAGADIVKVGIGPGAQCLTRRVAGVGVPQLSAVLECADAAHGLDGHICSDGGIVNPGDLGKAYGGGADFVMIGSVFAGHDENGIPPGNDGMITVYGMSSDTAQEKHYGKKHSYRASEGRTSVIKYKGSVENTVQQYLGGLRSTMTYIGARVIKDIPKCTTFIVVGNQLNKTMEGK